MSEKGHQFVELHVVCCLGGMSWEGCERGGVGADDAREERIVRNGVLKYDHARSQKKKKAFSMGNQVCWVSVLFLTHY